MPLLLEEVLNYDVLRKQKGMKPNKWNTTVTQYESSKYNISTASPFFSIIFCSLLIYINLAPPSLHISQFQNWLKCVNCLYAYGIYLLQPYMLLQRLPFHFPILVLLNHMELYLNLQKIKKYKLCTH